VTNTNFDLTLMICVCVCVCVCNAECWDPEPQSRPVFSTILDSLHLIAQSSFVETPNLSFHVLQDDWRNEIEFMFEELRSKEQVNNTCYSYIWLDIVIAVPGFGISAILSNLKCWDWWHPIPGILRLQNIS